MRVPLSPPSPPPGVGFRVCSARGRSGCRSLGCSKVIGQRGGFSSPPGEGRVRGQSLSPCQVGIRAVLVKHASGGPFLWQSVLLRLVCVCVCVFVWVHVHRVRVHTVSQVATDFVFAARPSTNLLIRFSLTFCSDLIIYLVK